MTAIKLLEAWNQFDEPTFTAAVQDSQQVDKMVSVGLALRSTPVSYTHLTLPTILRV